MLLDNCSVCNSDNIFNLYNVKGYTIAKCNNCNIVFVKDIVVGNDIKSIYTDIYFKNIAWYTSNNNGLLGYDDYVDDKKNIRDKFNKIIKIVKKFALHGSLLDVGCGPGFFLELANKKGFTPVQGIDISLYAVDYCINKLGLNVLSGDLLDMHLADNSYDVVTIFDVLEHFQNPKEELLEIYRILKHKGILAIITPDIDAFIPKLLKDHWEELKRVPEHLVFFSKQTLTNLLQNTGFEVLETKYVGKKMSFKSFLSHVFVNIGINAKLNKIPSFNINIPVNPFYKLLLIARKV